MIGGVPRDAFLDRVRQGAARYRIGPFTINLRSDVPQVGELLHTLYGDYSLAEPDEFIDYRLSVMRPRTHRRWVKPFAVFDADGDSPFSPLPLKTAFPLLEWGLNWCVATTAHQYLMLHAGVIEKRGVTVVLPALPGSGKSTLCAGLIHRGWRLLSDEFGMVRPGENRFVPFPRCIPLKNESVGIISEFAPEAVIGPIFTGTRKGDIGHLKPPQESVARADEPAAVTHVIFPHYEAGAAVGLEPIPKARAFIKLCSNSFNYEVFGAEGFHTVGDIIDTSECLLLTYGDLDEVTDVFERL